METIDLVRDQMGTTVTIELTEFELTTLVALVEEGARQMNSNPAAIVLHDKMKSTANEFCSLLGHLELLAADE